MVAAWLVLMMRLRKVRPFRRKGCSRGSRRRGGALSRRSEGLAVGMVRLFGQARRSSRWRGTITAEPAREDCCARSSCSVRWQCTSEPLAKRRSGGGSVSHEPVTHRTARDEGATIGGTGARGLAARFSKARRVDAVEPAGPEFRYRGGEQVGIGMLRRLHDHAAGAALHHLAGIEDHHLVADGAHRREIVADEHQRQAELAAQLRQQFQDRGTNDGVERRRHLVAQDQRGLGRQGAGKIDALLLAARQFAGQAIEQSHRQLHQVEQSPHPASLLAARQAVIEGERPAQDALDAVRRVEGGVGRLEDDLDAPQLFQAARLQCRRQRHAVQPHGAGGGRQQPGDDARQRAFARAGFADDAQRRTGADFQAYIAQNRYRQPALPVDPAVTRGQPVHFQQRSLAADGCCCDCCGLGAAAARRLLV